MKIDLDLSDIYMSEDGYKMKPEFVDLVASSIANDLKSEVRDEIRKQINLKITELILKNVEEEMPKILTEFLDYQYEEVTSWGEKKGSWTVRDRIAKALKDATGYEKHDSWSSSKESPFTKLVTQVIKETIEPMRMELYKTLNNEFKVSCTKEAAHQLAERFGLDLRK